MPGLIYKKTLEHTFKEHLKGIEIKMKRTVLIFCLFIFSFSELKAEAKQNPLFFSLGSHCEIADMFGHYGLRHIAGPLDWVLTLDYERFLLLLENDFEGFVDERYLSQYPDTHVINSLYNIDFRHDWPDLDFEKHLPEVQARLKRRVDRILDLKRHEGKVYFIRGAFDTNINPYLPTITKECTKITPQDAQNIRTVLQKKYPNLDFILVVFNYIEESVEEFNFPEGIIEFKVSKSNRPEKEKTYKQAIESLISIAHKEQ